MILCGDVLLEVLSWGDRRRLTKLERIGRRFHWSVVKFFGEMPFLRLNFELTTTTWYLFWYSIIETQALCHESYFLKNVKNTHYVILSKSYDNQDNHVLSNKMDVKFDSATPKINKRQVLRSQKPQASKTCFTLT